MSQAGQGMARAAATWPTLGEGRLPIRRILVVQTQRLGDVLCTTPLYTALREQFPAAQITALVHRPFDRILEGNPDLDDVITYDRQSTHRTFAARFGLIGELRRRQFDWVLSIHAASSVAMGLCLAGIPWRTCVWRYGDRRKPHWARGFQQHVRQERDRGDRHEIEHNLDVLRKLGMQPRDLRMRVHVTEAEHAWAREWLREMGRDESRPLAILHPGHGGGRQCWPVAHYSALVDQLTAFGMQVGITGSGGERELVEQVAAGARAPSQKLAGGTSLHQLAAVLAQADVFVSVPTGPMHMAAAMQVPVVALYGPQDLEIDRTRFYPYGTAYRAVSSPIPCPCPGHRQCSEPVCLKAITPSLAMEAVEELLRSPRREP